ncbi:hypothetical protein K449DRAFT_433222 [Hypoxylon sp. EC38]|nr:hypothetical protein K449DRAFT_433222 [Hypoxylon sp. EC38]
MDSPSQYRSPSQERTVTSPPTTPTTPSTAQSHQDTESSPIAILNYVPAEETADALSRTTLANSPVDTNTCILLTDLPAHTTPRQILANIRGIGRVYDIMTSVSRFDADIFGARIIFFERAAAERFLALCWSGEFKINGRVPGAMGYETYVNKTFLDSQLAQIISIGETECTDHGSVVGWEGQMMGRMEYRFVSYLKQACRAAQLLETRFGPRQLLTVGFGEDPCAWDENFQWKV